MSPVIGVGPRCDRCHKRPVWKDCLCSPCWRLGAAFGRDPAGVDSEPEPPGIEILDADSAEFDRRLALWLAGGDPDPPRFDRAA